MLKRNDIKLERISDTKKYLFIEKGGRISYIAKRYAKASNKYMNGYDPEKQSTSISYLDMNKIFGSAMSENLSYKRLKWLKIVDELDVMPVNEKSPIGYLLEVDLEYTDKLHELHNGYPLAPEKLAVSSYMLSKYCKRIVDKYEIKVDDIKILISNLGDKTNYVVHYRNLQLYLSL